MMGAIVYLGVDPGFSGALAFYEPSSNTLDVYDMPIFKLTKGNGGGKTVIDLMQLARIVDDQTSFERKIIAYVEDVGARPGEAPQHSFAFGYGVGCVLGVLAAHYLRIERVTPAKWKRSMACPADKDGARFRASQLLPEHAHRWPLVKHDGRAEASLIALYASQIDGGNQ